MVVIDYLSYDDFCGSVIEQYIKRQYSKYTLKHSYVIIGDDTDNFIDLVCEFTNTSPHELSTLQNGSSIVYHFYIVYSKELYISSLPKYKKLCHNLITSHKLQKEQLYEFTNFILNKFKLNEEFIEKVYNDIPIVTEHIEKFFETNVPQNTTLTPYDIDVVIRNVVPGYYRTCKNTDLLNNFLESEHTNETIKEAIITETALHHVLMPSMQFNNTIYDGSIIGYVAVEDIEMPEDDRDQVYSDAINACIKYNYMIYNMSKTNGQYEAYKENVETATLETNINKYYKMGKSISQYDSLFPIKPLLSMYSTFMDIFDNFDQDAIHNIVIKAIKNDNIILMKNVLVSLPIWNNIILLSKEEVKKREQLTNFHALSESTYPFYVLISGNNESQAMCILLNYILSKYLDIGKIYYVMNLANALCKEVPYYKFSKYMLRSNPDIEKMLRHECNFLIKYFKYGELDDNHREAILIRI